MRGKGRTTGLACAIFVALGACSVAAAAESSPESGANQTIAAGVTAAGVDVGGLSVDQAAALLEQKVTPLTLRSVGVWVGEREFRLSARRARLVFDPLRTAKRAYYAGRDADLAPSSAGGAAINVPAAQTYSRLAVRGWVAAVERQVARRARSARLRIGITKLSRRSARSGHAIDQAALERKLLPLLDDPYSDRRVYQPLIRTRPSITNADIRRRYPVVLTVDRQNFKLRLFKNLRLNRTYPIALGAAGFDTPAGLFRIAQKLVNPPWHAPNKPWAGAYAGQTIPGGAPNNPLKARWLGIADGVGIHGTAEEWSIGTRASHGCIRMRVADVIDLYPRVPLGTPVRISR